MTVATRPEWYTYTHDDGRQVAIPRARIDKLAAVNESTAIISESRVIGVIKKPLAEVVMELEGAPVETEGFSWSEGLTWRQLYAMCQATIAVVRDWRVNMEILDGVEADLDRLIAPELVGGLDYCRTASNG